ncbi:MAG: hypothetical protein ACREJO_00910 [Phycisphaerales bacterium]
MRLPTDKVWRAFPELDRFSDEQCRGFVKAARRAWGWRLVRVGAMLVSLGAAFIAGAIALAGTLHLLDDVWRVGRENAAWAGAVAAGMLTMAVFLLGGMFVRDWLLRKRIRFAIFNRGVCQKCDYSLVGMPVSAKSTVMCPECGMESEVDPALGELARDNSGKPVLRAVDESLMPKVRKPRVFTAARMKKAAKWAGALALTLVIGAVGWYVWDRYDTAKQAELAQKERPGAEAVIKHQEAVLPAAKSANEPDGWELVDTIKGEIEAIDLRVWKNVPESQAPDYMFFRITARDRERMSEENLGRLDGEREVTLRMFEQLKATGVFDDMNQLAATPRAVWMPLSNAGVAASLTPMPELSSVRALARINGLRMHLAWKAGDVAEFERALEGNRALARFCATHPTIIGQLVGVAIEALTAAVVRDVLAEHPDVKWLDAIDAATARQRLDVPRDYALRGERLLVMDTLAWTFSDPGRVSGAALRRSLGLSPLEGRVGSYTANRDVLAAQFDRLEKAAVQNRWERGEVVEGSGRESGLILVAILMPALGRAMHGFDMAEMERDGLAAMTALERFRLRTGGYPERLEELMGREIKSLPIDPWSGRALGYRRIDPAGDEQGRGYLLWSVGGDGKDNGGKSNANDPYRAMTGKGVAGTDLIINDRAR